MGKIPENAIGSVLISRNWKLVTAESCTAGLIASRITDVPGSSAYFDRSYVTYSNQAKMQMLGVPEEVFVQGGCCKRILCSTNGRRCPFPHQGLKLPCPLPGLLVLLAVLLLSLLAPFLWRFPLQYRPRAIFITLQVIVLRLRTRLFRLH